MRAGKILYLRYVLPISYIHHIQHNFGYCLFAFLPTSLAFIENSKIAWSSKKPGIFWYRVKHHDSVPCWMRWGFRIVRKDKYHNCTYTGVY